MCMSMRVFFPERKLMDRLWVRLSLAIGALIFVLLGLLVVVIFGAIFMRILPPVIDDGPLRFHDIWRELLLFTGTIGTLSGVLVSRILSAPLTRLAAAAHQIGEGDLSTRITLRGSREVKDLAHSFNKMAADLEHAETLRNNLMADVSHELRTPLTVLEGNLRAALDNVYELEEEELANLYGQTRHLIRLVNDLRELALADAHQLSLNIEQTNLTALISEIANTFAPLATDKGITLTKSIAANMPPIYIDAVRIRQVLHNLLDNALRHTPIGGRITISAQPANKGITLTILDSGEGLESAQLAHVFDRFYRTDKSRSRESGGTGLGLAIVKAIIHEHGGTISAHSDGLGCGTEISIWLPVVNSGPHSVPHSVPHSTHHATSPHSSASP